MIKVKVIDDSAYSVSVDDDNQALVHVRNEIVSAGSGEKYKGNYVVVPKTEAQVLTTRQKYMTDNVTVKGVPCFEVSNNADGTTFIIGG